MADAQRILETFDVKARVRAVLGMVERQLEVLPRQGRGFGPWSQDE